ncbi:MAG: ATP-binding protein [Desulfococcaceae bacterium]
MKTQQNAAQHHAAEHKHYYRNLSVNMLLTVVFVSFLPMIFVSGAILYQFQESYSEKVMAHLRSVVNKHTQNIDNFLKERRNNIQFLNNSFACGELSDEFFLQRQLANLQQEYGNVFSDLGVVDYQGKQLAYAGPYKLEHADYSDSEWFKKALSSQSFISDVFLGLRGFPHFIVTVRSFHEEKPWVLRATVDFQSFNNLVKSIHFGKTGIAFVMNRRGEFQTGTSLKKENVIQLYRKVEASVKPGEDVQTGTYRNPESGKEMIYVARFIKDGDWALIYLQDSDDAFADLRRAHWIAVAVFIAGGLLIIGMAVFVSRRMIGRIAEADREKDLMNQQVIEAGRLASLGEMAAGIAHEINNPVAIMVEEAGWVGDLMEEAEFKESENLEEFKRALGQIKKQGLRCRDITHKLLSFARGGDGSQQLVKINDMVEEVTGLFSHQAKFKNVVIEPRYSPDLPYIEASQTEIQQILFNLIGNAIDAMENTGGKIQITTGYENHMVTVEVRDNGPGIPRTVLSRIFDPFYTTKPVGKGTGLGLSICYGIVNRMGGKITVSSAIGVGTTFRVMIPDQDGPGPDSNEKTDQEPGAQKTEKN